MKIFIESNYAETLFLSLVLTLSNLTLITSEGMKLNDTTDLLNPFLNKLFQQIGFLLNRKLPVITVFPSFEILTLQSWLKL